MKNLKSIILLTGMVFFSLSTVGQQRPGAPRPGGLRPGMEMERLEAAKIGFLTQKLDLSSKEAEKFWPVYNQYQKEMREVAKERMAKRRAEDQASAEERLNEQLEAESRVLEIRKKYTREFSKVISTEKVLRLFEAEKQFRQELIKRMQERRKN